MDFEGVAVEAPAAGGWTLSASLVTDPMQSGGAALLLARARIDTPYP